MKENVFSQWVERYQPDPVLFVQEVLGVDPDEWQIKFLRAIARGDRKISLGLATGWEKYSKQLGHALVLYD
jgi:hypothetical protein